MDTTRARDLGLAESLAGRRSRTCLCSRLSLWSHLKDFWFTMPSHFLFALLNFAHLAWLVACFSCFLSQLVMMKLNVNTLGTNLF
jgi:hypothetical protein